MRLFLLLFFPLSLFAEIVLTSQKTRIYALNGTIIKTIEKNTKLNVSVLEKDKKYFQIGNTQNLILAAHTLGFEQMLNQSEKDKLELENAFKSRQRELLRLQSEFKTMEIQILETERDTALSYQSSSYSRTGGRYTYSYTRLISQSKARKLIEVLMFEKDKLKQEKIKLFKESMNLSAALSQNQLNVEQLSKIFTGKDKNHSKFIITKKNAAVFSGSQVFTHLKYGELLTARQHPQHKDFHQVILNKKIYTIASSDLANIQGLKLDYNKRITSNLSAIEFQKTLVKDLQTSIILLQSVIRQLAVDKAVSGYVKVKNMTIQIDPQTVLVINNQNGSSVYVHNNRAKDVIEEWLIRLDVKKLDLKSTEANMLIRQKNDVDLRQEQSNILALLQ
ncbi:hypothetical protein PQO03_08830 [Lentisphaera profundi]|uniref:RND transporter n=1 Tax=Lentisphaera profundi TaxID=1658616 RepID=A0ABY7VUN3_9BACT|nr:hypothetical protein [Lentisphaera profundi]WDE95818.1 hypothetical protein PQO03_08830 [Lentisphaera profundi]